MTSRFDTYGTLLQTIDPFWVEDYAHGDVCEDVVRASAWQERVIEGLEAAALASQDRTSSDRYYSLPAVPLRLEAANKVLVYSNEYGNGMVYGNCYLYGVNLQYATMIPHSAEIAECAIVTDSLVQPTQLLFYGLDFLFVGGNIAFFDDPVATQPHKDFWVIDTRVAVSWLTDMHGRIVAADNLPAAGVAAVSSAQISGGSELHLAQALASMTGCPCANYDETVVATYVTPGCIAVITDRSSYRLPGHSAGVVTVGTVLSPGQSLCDTWQITTLTRTSAATVSSLTIPASALRTNGPITFDNATVDVVVTTVSNRPRVSWALGGEAADVAAFWDGVHAAGIANGKLLAECLDTRPYPSGLPGAADLPRQINPLQFLLENFFAAGVCLVRLRAAGLSTTAPGISTTLLADLLPARTLLIVQWV